MQIKAAISQMAALLYLSMSSAILRLPIFKRVVFIQAGLELAYFFIENKVYWAKILETGSWPFFVITKVDAAICSNKCISRKAEEERGIIWEMNFLRNCPGGSI